MDGGEVEGAGLISSAHGSAQVAPETFLVRRARGLDLYARAKRATFDDEVVGTESP